MYLGQSQNFETLEPWLKDAVTAKAFAFHLRELAARVENVPSGAQGEAMPFLPLGENIVSEKMDYLSKVRSVLLERQARREILGVKFVDDPAWAILLDLFEAHLTQRTRSIKGATIASGVPSTTALRHLTQLEAEGFLARRADVFDKRCVLVEISDKGLHRMIKYFQAI